MSSTGHHHSTAYVAYVVLLVTVVNAFNTMDRMALAVLAPSIQVELELSDSQLGLLTGFAFALFYAICGIPVARWADRGIRRNIIALALATWSAMTALSGAAQNFWHLFFARVGVGAGEAGGAAPAGSILCDYTPLQRRPVVFAIQAFGFTAGIMLGMVLAGKLGELIGWRWTFVALGLPGLALAVIVRLTLREPTRGAFDAVKDNQASFRETLEFLLRCRTYRLLAVFLSVNGFAQYGLIQWLPSFYARIFGLDSSSVGVYLGLAIGAGSGCGMLVGGILATKAAQRDVSLPFKLGMGTIAFATLAAVALVLVPSARGSMCLVAVCLLLLYVPFGAVSANVFSVVRPRMRAMAGAIAMFAASLLGVGLGPFSVGLLSDLLAPAFGMQSLRYALLVPASLLPLLVLLLRAANRALAADLKVSSNHA